MRNFIAFVLIFSCLQVFSQARFDVSSLSEFEAAQTQAVSGDSIVWQEGIYADVFMDIEKSGLIITAKEYGAVTFNGASKVEITSDSITLSGFQFVGGDIGTDNVIGIWGSDILISQVNIQDYTSYKYLIIDEDSRRTTVRYCNFENRLNLDDQNILSILVDSEPGYHKVQRCSFKNFDGEGNDMGIEPVRIGVSSQGHLNSRSTIEYCYFYQCDGDGELISNKAAENVIRYNTFKDNTKGEVVLRHGSRSVIYGNFFIGNMGGVRVREGSDHFIFNNYFEGLIKRAIYLQNDASDPLSNIGIYYNTIINSREVRLGGTGDSPPTNVTFANNIFTDPQSNLFKDATGNETWIGNISSGSLGISRPAGLVDSDPEMSTNSEGYFQLDSDSPAINAAGSGYPTVPLYEGMSFDHEILLDIMKQGRPEPESNRDLGVFEYSSTVTVKPQASEDNTGPIYLLDSEVEYLVSSISDLLFAGESGTKSLVICSNLEWEAGLGADWISTNVSNGSDCTEIQVSVSENLTGEERKGILIFTGGDLSTTVLVTQKASNDLALAASEELQMLSLFPNPAQDTLNISNLNDFNQYQIFDESGKIVQESTLTGNQIAISNLIKGIYFLELSGDSRKERLKFLKK